MPILLSINLKSHSLPVAQRFIQEQFPGAMPDRLSRQPHAYILPGGAGTASASFSGPVFNLADSDKAVDIARRIEAVAEQRGMTVRMHGA